MNRDELLEKYAEPIKVLDHGHVRLIDVMGDDERIEQAARVSYQKGTRTVSDRRSLLRHLLRHQHATPFEKCVIELDIKLPMFVRSQFHRHRTQSINEVSARYSELPEEFYVPEVERIQPQSKTNKQGREGTLPSEAADYARRAIQMEGESSFDVYRCLLGEEDNNGIARELARVVLPVNTYTQYNTTMNLRNLLHFLQLRLDEHAQYEARVYAEAISRIVADWVPLTWEAFNDYVLGAHTFSRQEMEVLRMAAPGWPTEGVWNDLLGRVEMSQREKTAFFKALELST